MGGGKACVAGLCLPDKNYDPSMERKTCDDAQIAHKFRLPEGVTIEQLRKLQCVHDALALRGLA